MSSLLSKKVAPMCLSVPLEISIAPSNGHHNLYFPGGKISIHTKKDEFQTAALHPTYGSQDFCLIVEDDMETVKQELEANGIHPLLDIAERHGAHGTMRSLYVRDPDGNLVELSSYR